MRQPMLRLMLVAVAWSLTAIVSFAQMGYDACSLEWLVADSDVVVRATVAGVERSPVVQVEGGLDRNPEVWKTVTLNVHEALKGDPTKALTFVERTYAFNNIYEGWRDVGQEQLWFLVRNKERGERDGAAAYGGEVAGESRLKPYRGGWSVVRLGPSVPEERGFSSIPPPIFTMDLNVVEKPTDILKTARAAVGEGGEPGGARGHNIELPRRVMQRSGKSGDANFLTVPADRRLAPLARRLIESPGDFLRKGERVDTDRLRLEGVKALRYFRSEENIALLKSLLDDPASSIHVSPAGMEGKVYDIREAAYEALRLWGIAVSEPVLREAPSMPRH